MAVEDKDSPMEPNLEDFTQKILTVIISTLSYFHWMWDFLLLGSKLVEPDGLYLGYEQWLPDPPKVQKPRSVFNAASLAYIGDCIYEVHLWLLTFQFSFFWNVMFVSYVQSLEALYSNW